jgi:hypothetical protein
MEKSIRVFRTFEDAEQADREFYMRLTPQERIEIISRLREQRHPAADQQGFQRVYRITPLKRG